MINSSYLSADALFVKLLFLLIPSIWYGVFNNIPKTYGNLQCPVWTDGEGTTSWIYANDTDKELRIGIRGA